VLVIAGWLITAAMGSLYGTYSAAADASNRQQAIDMALQQNGGDGKVLGVQTEKSSNGQTVFAVKVLSNGRVRVFRIRKAD
jgi:hypothetical protein